MPILSSATTNDIVRMRCGLIVAFLVLVPIAAGCADETSRIPTAQASAGSAATPVAQGSIDVSQRSGTDWPKFLGPRETGISDETRLLNKWPKAGPPLIWQIAVGTGYSAPSVLGERLVLHHRPQRDEVIECFSVSSGESLWKQSYPSRFEDPYGYNNGPRCTPLLTDERCYTLGAEGVLSCLNLADGSVVWQRNLQADFQIPPNFFGVGATPILEGDRLIVLVGGQPNSGVVAFDAANGKTLWEAVGRQTWDGAETGWTSYPKYEWTGEEKVVSYSSPIAATIHGQRHLLCLMRQGLVSLDPETGQERFHHWFMSRTHDSVNAARPVVVDDTIMLSAAYRVGSVLLKVRPGGAKYDVVWEDSRNLHTHWSTAIHIDGYYYGFSGRHKNEGELRCIDAEDGSVVWAASGWERGLDDYIRDPTGAVFDTRTREAIPEPFYGRGSAILADGKFIVLGESGTLALVNASHEGWQEVSRCAAPGMQYPSWTAPVLSRGLLFLRDEDALVCLDLRGE